MTGGDMVLRRLQKAELLKLGSLWSVWFTTATTVGGCAVVAYAVRANARRAHLDVSTPELLQTVPRYAVIAAIVLGVLASTSEYTTRQIARSLVSAPRRGLFLMTKASAVAMAMLATSLVGLLVAHLVLSTEVTGASATTLALSSVYLTLISLICVALGMILRQLTATLATCLIVLVVAPPLLTTLTSWGRWLPSEAGARALSATDLGSVPVSAALALLAWTAAAWVGALIRVRQSDA